MPNPDALLLKKFFVDGWFVSEWFINDTELHTVPQISVADYKSYFKIYLKEKRKELYHDYCTVEGKTRLYAFIRENIDKWQKVYNELCDREGKYDEINELNNILKKFLYMPGYFLTPTTPQPPWYPDTDPDPWHPQQR